MRANIPSPALAAVGFAALAAAQVAVPSSNGFSYAECAVEPFENGLSNTRALHARSMVQLSNMTVEQCAAYCVGYNYMGVEYGSECYCGNLINQGTTVDTSGGCNAPCAGSSSEQCGGSGRMDLYTSSGAPAPNLPSTFTPNATASTPLSNWNYVNCAVEPFYVANANTSVRALTGDGTTTSQMTVEYCAQYCAGYAYFGVEYTDECYCGNAVDPRTQLESCGKCNSLCSGDVTETCGGPGHLSLYKASNATVPNFAAASACSVASSSATATGTGSAASPTMTGVSCPAANGTTYVSGSQTYIIECGIDRQGSNIYSEQTSSFGACLDQCALVPGCNDVSYVYGNCYLKNQVNAPTNNSNVSGARLVSGVSSPQVVYANGASGSGASGGGQLYNYLGVVNDPTSTSGSGSATATKALTAATTASSKSMTLESCATFCSGYSYFGVEGGNTCYCGNTFTNGTTLSSGIPTNPITTCTGNSQEQCGGAQEMTVYAVPGAPTPFDSNGNLLAGAGTGSTVTASASAACNTNSATVCGPSATCVSLGASSSTCSLTVTPTAATTSSAVTTSSSAAAVTASVLSACNTNSGTVCGSTASCVSQLGTASICVLTAAGATITSSSTSSAATTSSSAATITASVLSACNTNSGTVCGSTASCVSQLGAVTSICVLTGAGVATTTASLSSACNTAAGTVCASGTATCNAAGICAVSTSTQTATGGSCAPSGTPAVACFSGATCKNNVCSVTATSSSSSSSAAAGVVTVTQALANGLCAPTASPIATACFSGGFCGANNLCSVSTITASASGGACAPAATPASVCPAGATCGANSQCAIVTSTQSTLGGSCAPQAIPATVCATTATCGTDGKCSAYATSTQTALGGACSTNALPATVCQAGVASCASVAAGTSTCAQSTAASVAIGGACYTGTAAAITPCGAQATCTGGSSGSGTCAYPTITATSAGAQCTQPAIGAATACGSGLSCSATGTKSVCAVSTTTVGFGSACAATATPAVACPTDGACVSGTCKYSAPSTASACSPNVDISTCGTVTATSGTKTLTYTNWYNYTGLNNGLYQPPVAGESELLVPTLFGTPYTSVCSAAKACASYTASNAAAYQESFGMVLVPGTLTCYWQCASFTQHNGPAFSGNATGVYYYPFAWSQ